MEVTPVSPYRLPLAGGMDGVLRRRGGVLERLLHHRPDNDADRRVDHRAGDDGEPVVVAQAAPDDDGEPVVVRVAQTAPDAVLFGARARTPEAARNGIERMRFALGVDDELSGFYEQFAHDPLIGRSVRSRPWLRVRRRPEPFEALAWAICEQLIEYERAAAIQRRIVRALGPRGAGWDACRVGGDQRRVGGDVRQTGRDQRWVGGDVRRIGGDGGGGLRDVPSPRTLAGAAPAHLESLDLSGSRARLLVRVAREVASGRVDLHDADHERAWSRLRAIPGVGPWTVEMLALKGQGRHDQVPAGDLGLLKYVARRLSGGDPRARACEEDVRVFFAPYGRWGGLAAVHVLAL